MTKLLNELQLHTVFRLLDGRLQRNSGFRFLLKQLFERLGYGNAAESI